MSVWIAGATVGSGVIGMGQAASASAAASASSDKAIASTERIEQQRLDLAYEQWDEQLARYDEWMAIYGPIEENLGEFYNNLTPEVYEAAGLEYNQQEFQKQKTQTVQTLAQRGLDSSGLLASTERQMNVSKAKADATVRRDAPFKVAEEQKSFLAQGKGGPQYAPQGNVGDVLGSSNLPSMYADEARRSEATASSMWGSAGSMLSTGLQYGAQNYVPTANTGTVQPGGMSLDPNPRPTIQMPG